MAPVYQQEDNVIGDRMVCLDVYRVEFSVLFEENLDLLRLNLLLGFPNSVESLV
jgi:hypothetical protein